MFDFHPYARALGEAVGGLLALALAVFALLGTGWFMAQAWNVLAAPLGWPPAGYLHGAAAAGGVFLWRLTAAR